MPQYTRFNAAGPAVPVPLGAINIPQGRTAGYATAAANKIISVKKA